MMEEKRIPNTWIKCQIREIGNIQTGTTPPKINPAFYSNDYPFYKPTDLEAGVNVITSTDGLSELGIKEARYVPENTTLVTCIGATIGKTGFIRKGGGFNQQINSITPHDLVSPKYIYFQAISHFFQSQIIKNASATTLPILNKGKFEILEMAIAPFAEQQRIVAKIEELFSSLDKGIETLKTAQAQLKIYRQAVLKYAFEGRLTNPNLKEGELPEGWEISTLGKVTIEKSGLRRGPFGSAIKKEFFVEKGYKVYEQGNAINNDPYRGKYFITKQKFEELKNFEVLPGDLLVSCSGVTLGRIVEIPDNALTGVINQALLRIRLVPGVIFNKYFIHHFRAEFFQRKIFEQSQGTAMPNLVGIKDFKEIQILVPPPNDQLRVIEEIESRLSVCDKIEESIEQSLQQAEALRQSILKKAFEGKLVPQDPKDELASVLLERIKAEREKNKPVKAAKVVKEKKTRTKKSKV